MSTEYRAAVLKAYLEKRNNHTLSRNLINPSPGMIKAECITAFEWYEKSDDPTLKLFVVKKDNDSTYLQAIRNEPAATFKAMSNFFKDKTEEPVERTIELLAFLINFKPRPYRHDWKPLTPVKEVVEKEPESLTPTVPTIIIDIDGKGEKASSRNPIAENPQPVRKFSWNIIISITMLFLVVISAGGYWLFRDKIGSARTNRPVVNRIQSTGKEKCMYWAGERYLPATCDQKHGDTMVVELDTAKMINIRKITDLRTITEGSINHVRYARINGTPEFYTQTSGEHYPADTIIPLRPLSKWIYEKYVKNK